MALVLIPDCGIVEEIFDVKMDDSEDPIAFDHMISLQSYMDCQIVVPSQVEERMLRKFNEDHAASFFSQVGVDYSTKNHDGYNSVSSYQHLVSKKSYRHNDLIIFVSDDHSQYDLEEYPSYAKIYKIPKTSFLEFMPNLLALIDSVGELEQSQVEKLLAKFRY